MNMTHYDKANPPVCNYTHDTCLMELVPGTRGVWVCPKCKRTFVSYYYPPRQNPFPPFPNNQPSSPEKE